MTDINNSVNQVLMEMTKEELLDHLRQHGKHYLLGVGLAAAGLGGVKGYKAYQAHKRNKGLKGHLMRNRETYAGAALGGISSLASSHGKPIGTRLKNAALFSASGGLGGAILNNMRRSNEYETKLKAKS